MAIFNSKLLNYQRIALVLPSLQRHMTSVAWGGVPHRWNAQSKGSGRGHSLARRFLLPQRGVNCCCVCVEKRGHQKGLGTRDAKCGWKSWSARSETSHISWSLISSIYGKVGDGTQAQLGTAMETRMTRATRQVSDYVNNKRNTHHTQICIYIYMYTCLI